MNLFFNIRQTIPVCHGNKIFNIMRLSTILCMLTIFCSSAKVSHSQVAEISLNLRNVTIKQALEEIKMQSEYSFYYRSEEINLNKIVSIQADKQNVIEILNKLFVGQGLAVVLKDKHIVIYKNEPGKAAPPSSALQTRKVAGTIKDIFGEPVIGVNIIEKGTTNGVVTDIDGNFTINVPNKAVLQISYIGYLSQEIQVGNNNNLSIILREDTQTLEEVVVVGYGTQKKVTLTGAVSTIKGGEIVKSPVPNLSNAIVGRTPGIMSKQAGGAPGDDDTTLRIRGIGTLTNDDTAAPLVLVDGIERSFNQLDPNEVESITVLKDASSTAVYGIRGANGVILVTTKRGTKGAPKVSYSGNVSLQTPTRMPEFLNAYDFSTLYLEGQMNDDPNATPIYSAEELQKFKEGSDPLYYPDINWLDYLMKDYAPQTQHNLNVSGGNDLARYYISLGYLNQDGLWENFTKNSGYDNNDHYNRYNFRSNIDVNVTPTTLLNFSAGGYASNRNTSLQNSANPFTQVYQMPANAAPGIIDNKVIVMARGNYRNPIRQLMQGFKQISGNSLDLNLGINQKLDFITEGLSARAKVSYDNFYTQTRSFSQSDKYYLATHIDVEGTPTPVLQLQQEGGNLGEPKEEFTRNRKLYVEWALEYNRSFNKHNVGALLLYNQKKTWYHTYDYPGIPLGYQDWVGRVTYNFDYKYLLEFNLGRNGSENFPKGNRFGWFPALSGGWVISNESFVKNLIPSDILSHLKIRASYGEVGNDRLGNARFMYYPAEYLQGNGAILGDNPVKYDAWYEGKLGNPNVTWERSKKQDYAIEMRFLNDRLNLSADFFIEKRDNILTSRNTVPGHVAATLQDAYNIGIVNNKGYELEGGWTDNIREFNYWIKANLSFARNKIIYMDEAINEKNPLLNKTGTRVGEHFGYTFLGFFNTQEEADAWYPQFTKISKPGDVKYADVNGDEIIDENDRQPILHPSFPEIAYGISGGFTYKGIDFSVLFAGAANFSVGLGGVISQPFSVFGSATELAKERWYEGSPDDNTHAKVPRLTVSYADNMNYQTSSLWLKDASYLRLKNLEIGYTFENELLKKVHLNSLRLYLSGQNLFTWDNLKVIDPENVTGNSMRYPQLKVYNIGCTLNF